MTSIGYNPAFQPNVNQAAINRTLFQTASPAEQAEFLNSLDGSVRAIFQDPNLTPEQKSAQAILIQQGRTLNLLG